MKFRVTSVCSIPDDMLLDNGIDLNDKDAIEEFFWATDGPFEWEDHGEGFEILCE